jgi:drug/metabolite transporter (DMT)-like permease
MVNQGLFFALLTTITWSICIFPFTQAARRLGVNPLNIFRLLLATIIIGIAALFMGAEQFYGIFSPNYTTAWLWLGFSGVLGLAIGDYFSFAMYRVLGARTGSVMTTFAPAAALITGAFLIDEKISFIGIIGIAITIAGVNFVSFGKRERESIPDHGHGSVSYGIIAGILSALCQGAGLVLAKKGIDGTTFTVDPVHATFIRLSAATAALLFVIIIRNNYKEITIPVITNKNNGVKYAILGTIFGPVLGMSFSLFSVSTIEPTVAQTIFSLVPACALLISRIFMKEKISTQSLAGLFIAIAGVIILIWREQIKFAIT